MDRRTFLRGSVGLAMAGTLVRFGDGTAAADPSPSPGTARPPASWPPTPGAYAGLTAPWLIAENLHTGSNGWRIGTPEPPGALASARDRVEQPIEGYLNTTSIALDEPITFRVSTTKQLYFIEAYRMGWYGGTGGRLVWRSEVLRGQAQAAPKVDQSTNLVEAEWEPSYELTPRAPTFAPGCYLFRLVASGASRFVPLTIRDDSSTARYVVVNAVADWQAYNEWGGASLYYGRRSPTSRSRDYGARARVVSFDRPYDWGLGAGDFIGAELPLIMRMEEAGLDVTYLTSVDVHADPARLKRHRVAVSLAHDEYWTSEMRAAFEGARDDGVNLCFFGANAMFRQVRLEDSPLGRFRREVCYKSSSEDPTDNRDLTTVNWRDAPITRPEAAVIGVQYDGQGFADLEVTNPEGWIWEQTGVGYRQKFPGVVGPEFDKVFSPSPGNIEIFARSAIREKSERETWADTAYYSAPSGAGVFATGTIGWLSTLSHAAAYSKAPRVLQLYHATMNVLRLFGAGPAGAARPSIHNSPTPSKLPPLPKKPIVFGLPPDTTATTPPTLLPPVIP